MKNIKLLYILFLIIAFSSCDDYLEPKTQDKIIPTKVSHLKELLLGEVIVKNTDPISYLEHLTDDINHYQVKSVRNDNSIKEWGYYTWQADPEKQKDNDINEDKAWESYYHDIFVCNIIISQTNDMQGSVNEKNALLAETYFMRAYSYFMLVNLYGEPYDKNTATTALGVPINEETGIFDKTYLRNSVSEVYEKIESDLSASINYFKKSTPEYYIVRPSLSVAHLLRTRVALYKKEYAKVIEYSKDAIATNRHSIVNLNNYAETEFLTLQNPEIIFCTGYSKMKFTFESSWLSHYTLSRDLLNTFESGKDLRESIIKAKRGRSYLKLEGWDIYGKSFRLSELYLNKAEALAYNTEDGWKDAIELLNKTIRINRYKTGEEYKLSADTKEKAIELIRAERRRELCMEYHRWFDLRRYGMPELKHEYGIKGEKVTYTLTQGSPSYTLPIPRNVIDKNNEIKQIKRQEQPGYEN